MQASLNGMETAQPRMPSATNAADRSAQISSSKGLVDKVQSQFAIEEIVKPCAKVPRPARERHAKLRVFINCLLHENEPLHDNAPEIQQPLNETSSQQR
jgi:hypothetical protein